MKDPAFINVLIVGLTAIIAVGAVACALLLSRIHAALVAIEKNQREGIFDNE